MDFIWKYGDDRGGVYLVRLWSEDKNNRFKRFLGRKKVGLVYNHALVI